MAGRPRRSVAVAASFVWLSVAAALAGTVGPATARVRSTPPPTPVHGTPSPFPTVLHTPTPSVRPPKIRAAAAIVEDIGSGQVLFGHQPNMRRAIASITKIMTAVLVLDRAGLAETVRVTPRAAGQTGSVLGVRPGERITVKNLLYALMLQSSNDAAVALAEHVAGSEEAFVRLMNAHARAIGLRHSRFYSSNGLDDRGYSTPADLARLTRIAEGHPEFVVIAQTKARTIPSSSGPARHVQNRNVLLWLYRGATGVKTGFTTPAGHCLVATAERAGRGLVAVVLGEPSDENAFSDGAALLSFGFGAFVPVTLLRAGQSVGPVGVDGRSVGAVAGSDLIRLVRNDQLQQVERRLVPRRDAHVPLEAGERVGTVVLLVAGSKVGSVAAVSSTAVDPGGRPLGPPVGRQPIDDVMGVLDLIVRSVFGSFL